MGVNAKLTRPKKIGSTWWTHTESIPRHTHLIGFPENFPDAPHCTGLAWVHVLNTHCHNLVLKKEAPT
jgi:hypothetical protein